MEPNNIQRRDLLKMTAGGVAAMVGTGDVSATQKRSKKNKALSSTRESKRNNAPSSKKTNGDPHVPSMSLSAPNRAHIPDIEVENKRKAFLNRVELSDRVLLEQNLAMENEDILGYGIRIENGSPVEYYDTVVGKLSEKSLQNRKNKAQDNVKRFVRGEV
ncbi:MAG: hypothetical protein ABEI57_06855 [Halapricum sp.]